MGDNHAKKKLILLYDGKCNICNTFVQLAIDKVNHKSEFYFASLQSKYARDKLDELEVNCFEDKKNPDIPTSSAVIVNGLCYRKWQASCEILRHLVFPYNVMGIMFSLAPQLLGDWLYDNFASVRFTLFGKTSEVQAIPDSKEHLFLDAHEGIHQCPLKY